METNERKLEQLRRIEGFIDQEEMLANAVCDSVCVGICMNERCDYTTEVEPDCRTGWCDECQDNTVASCLAIAGII